MDGPRITEIYQRYSSLSEPYQTVRGLWTHPYCSTSGSQLEVCQMDGPRITEIYQ